MSPVKVETWVLESVPFTINSLAASFVVEMGFTDAIALSQSGKDVEGKRALDMKISGSVRKLTMATRESMDLTESASAVKTQESPNPRSANAAKIPMKFKGPNRLGGTRPSGMTRAMRKVSRARAITLTRFCSTPEKKMAALGMGAVRRVLR